MSKEAEEVAGQDAKLESKEEGRLVLEGGEARRDERMEAHLHQALALGERARHRLLREHRQSGPCGSA